MKDVLRWTPSKRKKLLEKEEGRFLLGFSLLFSASLTRCLLSVNRAIMPPWASEVLHEMG